MKDSLKVWLFVSLYAPVDGSTVHHGMMLYSGAEIISFVPKVEYSVAEIRRYRYTLRNTVVGVEDYF